MTNEKFTCKARPLPKYRCATSFVFRDYCAEVLDSTKTVVGCSKHIAICDGQIARFCEDKSPDAKTDGDWLKKSPFPLGQLSEKDLAHLMLAFNSLSFSYWGDPYWQVTYKDTTYQRGSWSLIAALLRAREDGVDILDPSVQSGLSKSQLAKILRGNREIPLLEDRLRIINQVGQLIRDDYGSDFRNMIHEHTDAVKLLSAIINQIPSFEDTADYRGMQVSFYKRAQALAECMAVQFSLQGLDRLTALADYILPRKLRDEGILIYDQELSGLVDNREDIPPRSAYEVEIRANTVWAVEKIKAQFAKKNIYLSSKEINDHLWLTGDTENSEFHRTRTTAY